MDPAINPAPATASAKAIAKMVLRMIGSFSWLVTVADRKVQTTMHPLICAALA